MTRARLLTAWLLAVSLLAPSAAIPGAAPAAASRTTASPGVVHQLRIYEIFEGNKAGFHDRFRDHAMRIMARHDFRIVSTWEARYAGRTEFVYLLQWPDEATMKDRWAKFLADSEWVEIKRVTNAGGALVGEIEDRVLHLTDYSPVKTLTR
jgi:hypothetical protein